MPYPNFTDDPRGNGGHHSTPDITVAAVLATLGFKWRGSLPLVHVVHANLLQRFVDKQTGRIENLNRLSYRFDYCHDHPTLGRINATQVEAAVARQRILSDRSAGRNVPQADVDRTNAHLRATGTTNELAHLVAYIADGMENILLLAEATEEVGLQPLIKTARALRRGRLDILEPLETEPIVGRKLRDTYRAGEFQPQR